MPARHELTPSSWRAARRRDTRPSRDTQRTTQRFDSDEKTRAAHDLVGLYARALNELGTWLGDRDALEVVRAGGSAPGFARSLATATSFFDDRGFYKRAQITANDLVLAGVADFGDVDR